MKIVKKNWLSQISQKTGRMQRQFTECRDNLQNAETEGRIQRIVWGVLKRGYVGGDGGMEKRWWLVDA